MSALCRWYNWFIAIHWDSGAVTAAATIAIAFVTLILGVATWFLWRATRNLVRGHEIAVRQELRAYVSHEPGGFQWDGVSRRVKYFEKNFGRTPAKDLGMYVSIQNGTAAPPCFDGPFKQIHVMAFVAPDQNIGKIVGKQTPITAFFMYGYVDYTDIFEDRWRRRFAWSYDPWRSCKGDDPFIAHHEHNDEHYLGNTAKKRWLKGLFRTQLIPSRQTRYPSNSR